MLPIDGGSFVSEYNDNFGAQVAIEGENAAVFSTQYNTTAYRLIGSNWVDVGSVTANDNSQLRPIEFNNGQALASAPNDSSHGPNSGALYTFNFNGAEWVQSQKITAPDAGAQDMFGAFSADGNTMVVLAGGDVNPGFNNGSAYIYSFDGNAWNYVNKVMIPDSQPYQFRGNPLLHNGHLFIGVTGPSEGQVFVYDLVGNDLVYDLDLSTISSINGPYDQFGLEMAGHSDGVLIGAKNLANSDGRVFFFSKNSGQWQEEQLIQAENCIDCYEFGRGIDVDGNFMVVGCTDYIDYSGTAIIYEYSNSQWEYSSSVTSDSSEAYDEFASDVGISGDFLIVGAPSWGGSSNTHGEAYIFNSIVGVEAIDLRPQFHSFPNPFGQTLTIEWSGKFSSLLISDMTGREVINEAVSGMNRFTLEGITLPSGAYSIRLSGNSGTLHSKVMKQ